MFKKFKNFFFKNASIKVHRFHFQKHPLTEDARNQAPIFRITAAHMRPLNRDQKTYPDWNIVQSQLPQQQPQEDERAQASQRQQQEQPQLGPHQMTLRPRVGGSKQEEEGKAPIKVPKSAPEKLARERPRIAQTRAINAQKRIKRQIIWKKTPC